MPSIRNPILFLNSPTLPQLEDIKAYRGIPTPQREVNAVAATADALKEQMEILTRQRGFIDDSAIVVSEFLTIIDGLTARIDTLEKIIVQLVPAGYGGMALDTPVLYDIRLAFTTLPYDSVNPSVERGVTMIPASDEFTVNIAGVWQLMVVLNLVGHNSLNQGRAFDIRLFNVTTAAAAGGLTVGIGRNTEDTLISITALFEVPETAVGNIFRMEVGNAVTAITGGSLDVNDVQFVFVSELGSLITT